MQDLIQLKQLKPLRKAFNGLELPRYIELSLSRIITAPMVQQISSIRVFGNGDVLLSMTQKSLYLGLVTNLKQIEAELIKQHRWVSKIRLKLLK